MVGPSCEREQESDARATGSAPDMELPPDTEVNILEDEKPTTQATRSGNENHRSPVRSALATVAVAALVVLVVLAAVAELADLGARLASIHIAIAWAAWACAAIAASLLAVAIARELRRYWALAAVSQLGDALSATATRNGPPASGSLSRLEAMIKAYLEELRRGGHLDSTRLKVVAQKLDELYDGRSWTELLVRDVLAPLDERARTLIEQEARAVAVLVALSPWVAVDSLVVLVRNGRLVLRIARVYGLRPGLLGSLALLRRVLFSVALAGLTQELLNRYWAVHAGRAVASGARAGAASVGGILSKYGRFVPKVGLPLAFLGAATQHFAAPVGDAIAAASGPLLQGMLAASQTIRVGTAAQHACRAVHMTEPERAAVSASLWTSAVGVLRPRRVAPSAEEPAPGAVSV